MSGMTAEFEKKLTLGSVTQYPEIREEMIKMEVTLAVVLSAVVGFATGYFLVKKNVL